MIAPISTPSVLVVICLWDSDKYLPRCFEALVQQTYLDFEVLLVDNGSEGGSTYLLESHWPDLQLRIKRLNENTGFAAANNLGARLARGNWIAFLNADAFPEPDWLEKLLQATKKYPGYTAFSSRQIQYNDSQKLDGIGDVYHISGLAWRTGYNLSADKYGLEQKEIFSPCAAAALYSRDEFVKIGGFDEDFFSYFEDVDLGFRLRLQGKKCLYVSDAVVHHVGSASTGKRSNFSVYYGYRNMIWTFVKNMPSPYFWLFLPLHIFTVLFFAGYLTLRGQGKAISKAVFDASKGLPKMIEKRREIQRDIKINPKDLLDIMSTGLLEPLQEFLRRNKSK